MAFFAVAVIAAVYYFVDPSGSRWMPRCMFHTLTGWDCPGCGSQRMIHALLHGDLRAAWHHNAFLLVSLPGLAWLMWLELTCLRHQKLYARVHSLPVVIAVCLSIVVWTIGRNSLS